MIGKLKLSSKRRGNLPGTRRRSCPKTAASRSRQRLASFPPLISIARWLSARPKAANDLRHKKGMEEKQKSLIDELHKPFDRSADQLMQLVMQLIHHAAEHGQRELQVYRLPNAMCNDRGRRSELLKSDLPRRESGIGALSCRCCGPRPMRRIAL